MEDWIRWVIGAIITAWTAVISGLGSMILGKLKVLNDRMDTQRDHAIVIDKRLSLLEARPVVDPLEHIKAMTELTAMINTLVADVKRLTEEVAHVCDRVEQLSKESKYEQFKSQTR